MTVIIKSARIMKTSVVIHDMLPGIKDDIMRNIELIVATIDHIEAGLGGPLTLESVADELGYSRYYLHRVFTKTVGLTMYEYIQRRRLTEAARLLVFSDKPIVEIALLSGYDSQQAFSSVFKSMYKIPPRQFRENEGFYPLQMRFDFDETILRANLRPRSSAERSIILAGVENIQEWMSLVRLVIDGFPCLDENGHVDALKQYIADKSAFIMKEGNIAIGIMMISQKSGSVDFLGIHPLYRNRGIGYALLARAMNELNAHKEISITTYREGDKADTGHRSALKELGFSERELLVEFGYPTQKMVIPGNTFRETPDV